MDCRLGRAGHERFEFEARWHFEQRDGLNESEDELELWQEGNVLKPHVKVLDPTDEPAVCLWGVAGDQVARTEEQKSSTNERRHHQHHPSLRGRTADKVSIRVVLVRLGAQLTHWSCMPLLTISCASPALITGLRGRTEPCL
eukprot:3607142-Prymnesium_polylepis.1